MNAGLFKLIPMIHLSEKTAIVLEYLGFDNNNFREDRGWLEVHVIGSL